MYRTAHFTMPRPAGMYMVNQYFYRSLSNYGDYTEGYFPVKWWPGLMQQKGQCAEPSSMILGTTK